MGIRHKDIWQAEEVLEESRCGVGAAELHAKTNALVRDGIVKPEGMSVGFDDLQVSGGNGAHFFGASIPWSVMTNASRSSPASFTAFTKSGVNIASVTSALSLITVAHSGSLA